LKQRNTFRRNVSVTHQIKEFPFDLCQHRHVDNFNMLGENIHTIRKNTEILSEASKEVGL